MVSSDIPAFGSPEWEAFVAKGGDKAFEDWLTAPIHPSNQTSVA